MPAFLTVKLLEFNQSGYHPWLTEQLADREVAIQQYQRDREQVFTDSLGSRNVNDPSFMNTEDR